MAMLAASLFPLVVACGFPAAQADQAFDVGAIDGVRMRIPKAVELSGVTFAEADHGAKDQRANDSYRQIEHFDLLLTLPDFVPPVPGAVLSSEDRLGADVSHADYKDNPNGPRDGWRVMLKDPRPYGPYTQRAEIYGLSHWHSQQFPAMTANADLFWSETSGTYIACAGDTFFTGKVRGGICVAYFNVPEIKSRVGMSFDRKWLSRWLIMKNKITILVRSFAN